MNSYSFRKLTNNDYSSYLKLIQQFRNTSYTKEQIKLSLLLSFLV